MKRIAIIDDHPIIRGTIASVLRADPELDLVGSAATEKRACKWSWPSGQISSLLTLICLGSTDYL